MSKLRAVGTKNISTASKGVGVKQLVSKKKRRHIETDEETGRVYDLDLTYITDYIIAMGYPAESMEALYRNDIQDVADFLTWKHGNRFMVYNLCSEKSYDHAKFDHRVVRFPFDDHNCPNFDDMEPFCEALDEWMADHEKNAAAIHCKAGKGRTGLVISTYLLHTGFQETAAAALAYYGMARTENQKGVTIPSQRRWVQYYEKYMNMRRMGLSLEPSRWYRLTRVFVSGSAPKWTGVSIFNKDNKYVGTPSSASEGGNQVLFENCLINKDVKVQFDIRAMFKTSRAFSFWFNTDFIENGELRLTKDDIDKVNKDKKCKDFYLQLFFELAPPPPGEMKDEDGVEEQKLADPSGRVSTNSATMSPTAFARRRNGPSDVASMSSEAIVVLALRLQDSIRIRNRTWMQKVWPNCWTGTDAVRWLKKDGGLGSADEAIRFGNMLIQHGVAKRVQRSDDEGTEFMDGPFFFQFVTSPPMSAD